MQTRHKCVITRIDSRDYIKGVNSSIPFKAVSNGDWGPRIEFFEPQKINGWDCDGCVLFAAQESFDAQMDNLIQTKQVPQGTLDLFNQLGYMDIGTDNNPHFHSSPRFLQILTGNGTNGNALQDPWIVIRKYGVLPWKDMPFDSTITQEDYFAPISPDSLSKAQQFLLAIGGSDSIQYHWVNLNDTNVPNMIQALPQAPLCIAGPADAPGWNNMVPPIPNNSEMNHSTMNYLIDSSDDCWIYDHYQPAKKELVNGYPIPQVLQGVVTVNPPPTAPTLPPNPTVPQEISWLDALKNWLSGILNSLKGR